MHSNDGLFVRQASPNVSDDGNSDSAMTTLPIGERKRNSDFDPDELQSIIDDVMPVDATNGGAGDYRKIICDDFGGRFVDSKMPSQRNTFACWAIVTIMTVLALGNLALTMTIIGVLRLGKGMQYMEFVPEANAIKFTGVTDLDRVYKRDGRIEGFEDVPVSITG